MWKRLWQRHRQDILILGGIAVLYGIMFLLSIPCPVKWLTGVSCPGCGMTRACLSALTFRFADAFSYHPLWVALPFVLAALVMLRCWKRQKAEQVLLIVSGLVMIAVWLYRICCLQGEVVTFRPEDGAVIRGIRWLLSFFV
ncbi:MAG: DUF2752 domain-containing protein [Clostridia bacterium]|nr:DUF2752 domain-containing protein [Clostridia bacterium]